MYKSELQCRVKCGLANAAGPAGQTGTGLRGRNAPTAAAEKCQKSNREIWKSVRASSQEIHLETCNEENNGVQKWREREQDTELKFCNEKKRNALQQVFHVDQ